MRYRHCDLDIGVMFDTGMIHDYTITALLSGPNVLPPSLFYHHIAERYRVILKGEHPDYMFAHVSLMCIFLLPLHAGRFCKHNLLYMLVHSSC